MKKQLQYRMYWLIIGLTCLLGLILGNICYQLELVSRQNRLEGELRDLKDDNAILNEEIFELQRQVKQHQTIIVNQLNI